MKNLILTLIILVLACSAGMAQSVGINSDGTAPDGSAMLDVKSTSKGFLAPRVASTANVTTPATGLLVYQTGGTPGYYYNSGTPATPAWVQLGSASGASQWATAGSDIYFNTGNVGIGTTTPSDKLHIIDSRTTNSSAGIWIQKTGAVAGTSYGISSSVTGAGTTNVGGLFSATGATNNYGLIVQSGNVGIGTTAPQAKLQVDGSVFINNAAAPGFYGQSAGTNKVYLGYDGAGTGLELYNFQSTQSLNIQDDGDLVYGGNVGIGTTTPVSALQLGSLTSISTVVNKQSLFGNNMYYTGGQTGTGVWKYITTAPASAMRLWADGSIRFHTVASGTAEATINIADMDVNGVKMIIQNDGNVGIGTTAPAYKLHIQDATSPALAIQYATNSDYPYLSSNSSNDLIIGSAGSGSHSVLKSNGFVGIGTTTPDAPLTIATSGGVGLKINNGGDIALTAQVSGGSAILYNDAGNLQVSASAGSGAFCTGTAWNSASDSRLKRDIKPMTTYGLSTVMLLKPVTYYYKADKTNHHEVGFIAQEVQKIVPEVVSGTEGDISKGETLGLSYGNLVPVLTKAIQEQQAEIEALKAENAAMKAKVESIDNLKAENAAMKTDMEALKNAVYGSAQHK